jgi:hypothetical protein
MGTIRLRAVRTAWHASRAVSLAVVLGLALAAATPAWASGTVSGSAFAVSVNANVAGINVTAGPTPTVTLPPTGGNLSQSVVSICAGTGCSVLSAGILNAATQGTTTAAPSSASSASAATVNVLAGVLTADAISSNCTADSSGVSGSASLVNAKLSGVAIAANPGPNTTLTVAGLATVILNEQTTSSSGGTNSITVNAVHVKLNLGLATGDIIISQSHCDANAGTVVPVGTIGVLGLTGLAGIGFAFMQHRGYRRRLAAAAARSAL